jgi:hypothetical protein
VTICSKSAIVCRTWIESGSKVASQAIFSNCSITSDVGQECTVPVHHMCPRTSHVSQYIAFQYIACVPLLLVHTLAPSTHPCSQFTPLLPVHTLTPSTHPYSQYTPLLPVHTLTPSTHPYSQYTTLLPVLPVHTLLLTVHTLALGTQARGTHAPVRTSADLPLLKSSSPSYRTFVPNAAASECTISLSSACLVLT